MKKGEYGSPMKEKKKHPSEEKGCLVLMELHETLRDNLVFEWDIYFPMGSLIGFIARFFEVKSVK